MPGDRTKRIALIACILGSGIVFLDGTVVNVALPAIRRSLGGGLAVQQWAVEAYLLTLSSLLLVGGSLGDLLGRRRVFRAGLVGFGVCSLLCALAPSSGLLIAARAVQGMAGALLVPSALALIMDTFQAHERAAAIGTWTAWAGIATVIGPLGGGVLIQVGSWRWVFAINLIPVALTLWLLRQLQDDAPAGGHVDVPGALLAAFGLGGPVFALIEQPHYGWHAPQVAVPLLVGVDSARPPSFGMGAARGRADAAARPVRAPATSPIGNVTTLAVYAGLGVTAIVLPRSIRPAGRGLHAARRRAVAAAGHADDVRPAPSASGRWRTASGRARSWPAGHWSWPAPACCCWCGSDRGRTTRARCCPA
jgi:MFS family permease